LTICFFHGFLCSFISKAWIIDVDLNLVHPQHFKSLKMEKKQGKYEILNKYSFSLKTYYVISIHFVLLLCCTFAFGVETYNVKLTLVFSWYFTSHKINQKNPKLFNFQPTISDGWFYPNIVYLLGILTIIVHNNFFKNILIVNLESKYYYYY
jgi:hypothetical protein